MIIHESESTKKIKSMKDNNDLVNSVITEVFAICKEDNTFSIKDELKLVEYKLTKLRSRLDKQDKLLEKSNELLLSLKENDKSLDNANFKIKINVLETLGSEL